MNDQMTVITLQSECPRDFVCYECTDDYHDHCVGVPCHCKYCLASIQLDGGFHADRKNQTINTFLARRSRN